MKKNNLTGTELKISVREEDEFKAFLKLNLGKRMKTVCTRVISFFDTENFDLYNAGVIVRSRKDMDGVYDTTIKYRPKQEMSDRSSGLFKFNEKDKNFEYKYELDIVPQFHSDIVTRIPSTSITYKKLETDRGILFNGINKEFIENCMPKKTFDDAQPKIKRLGHILSMRWDFTSKCKDRGEKYDIRVEMWTFKNGNTLFEISTPCKELKESTLDQQLQKFANHIKRLYGLEHNIEAQSKTKLALDNLK